MSVFDNISFEYGQEPNDVEIPLLPGKDSGVEYVRNMRFVKEGSYVYLKARGGTELVRDFGKPIIQMKRIQLGQVDDVKDYLFVQISDKLLLYDYNAHRQWSIDYVVLQDRVEISAVGMFLYLFSVEESYAKVWSIDTGLFEYNNHLPSGIVDIDAIKRTDSPNQAENIFGYKEGANILVYSFVKGEFISTKISRMDGDDIYYVNDDDNERRATTVFPFEERYKDLIGTRLSDSTNARARGSIVIQNDSNTGTASGTVSVTIGAQTSAGTAMIEPSDTHTEIGDKIAALINGDSTLSQDWEATASPQTYNTAILPFWEAEVRTHITITSKLPKSPGDAISLTLGADVSFENFVSDTEAYNISLEDNAAYGDPLWGVSGGYRLSRGYALVDELADGSLTLPGRPSIMSYSSYTSGFVGNILTFKAAPAYVKKRYLLSTLWRVGISDTLKPSSPDFSNSPYYINAVIDVDATTHEDFKSDEQLITPVEGFLPVSGGVSTQFGPGEVLPYTTGLIENTMVFGGYDINRPVPAIYSLPQSVAAEPDTVESGVPSTVVLSISNWTLYQNTYVGLKLDGTTYSLGGWNTNIADGYTVGGSSAAQLMADMLNGESVQDASGYSSLPIGLEARTDGSLLIIERVDSTNSIISLAFDAQWDSDVTAALVTHSTGTITNRPGNISLLSEGTATQYRAGFRFEYTDGRRSEIHVSDANLGTDVNLAKIHSLNTLVKAIDVCVVDDTQSLKGALPAFVELTVYDWHIYSQKFVTLQVDGVNYNVGGWTMSLPLSGDVLSGAQAADYMADMLNGVDLGLGVASGYDSFADNTFIASASGNKLVIERVSDGNNPFGLDYGAEWEKDISSIQSDAEQGKQGVKPAYLWKRVAITDAEAHGQQFWIPDAISGMEEITGYNQYADTKVALRDYITIAVPGQSVFIDKQQPIADSAKITGLVPYSFETQTSVIRFKLYVFTDNGIQQGVIEDLGTVFRGYFDIVDTGTVNETPHATLYVNNTVFFKSKKGIHALGAQGFDVLLRADTYEELSQQVESIGYYESADELWFMLQGGKGVVWQRQYDNWMIADFPGYSSVPSMAGDGGDLYAVSGDSLLKLDEATTEDVSVTIEPPKAVECEVLLRPFGSRQKGIYLLDTTVYGGGGTMDLLVERHHELFEPGVNFGFDYNGTAIATQLATVMSGTSVGIYERCIQPRVKVVFKPTSTNAFIESIRQRFNEYQLTGNARRTLWD